MPKMPMLAIANNPVPMTITDVQCRVAMEQGDKAIEQKARGFVKLADGTCTGHAYVSVFGTVEGVEGVVRATRRFELTKAQETSTAGISAKTIAHVLNLAAPVIPPLSELDAHHDACRVVFNAARRAAPDAVGQECLVRKATDPRYWELVGPMAGLDQDA